MRSMPQALLWEMLAHGRWSLPGYFAMGNAVPLLVYTALSGIGIDPDDPAFITLQFSFLPLIIFQFAIGIVAAHGPMARLYATPISAGSIVAWHMFSGGVVLGTQTAAAASLYNWLFDVGWPVWAPALFAAAAWACYQLLLCVSTKPSLPSFALALLPGMALFAWLQSRYGNWFSTPKHYWSEVTTGEIATLASVIAVSYAVTVWGVRRVRSGEELVHLGLGTWFVAMLDAWVSRSAKALLPFRSAAHAQFWYVWRLRGWVLPIVLAFVLLIASVGTLMEFEFGRLNQSDLHQEILGIGGILPFAAFGAGAFLGGAFCTNLPRRRESSLADLSGQFDCTDNFQATRPLRNIDFAKATLQTAALSSVIAWGMWFMLFAANLAFSHAATQFSEPVFPAPFGAWYLPLTLLGTWAAMANASVIGLSGRAVWFTVAIVILTLGLAFVPALLRTYAEPSVQERIGWTCVVLVASATIVAGLWALAKASHQKLLGRKAIAIVAAVLCAVVSAAIALRPMPLFFAGHLVILAFASLVVMPIATVPLAIGWNRHR